VTMLEADEWLVEPSLGSVGRTSGFLEKGQVPRRSGNTLSGEKPSRQKAQPKEDKSGMARDQSS